jgi:hypothetical protein
MTLLAFSTFETERTERHVSVRVRASAETRMTERETWSGRAGFVLAAVGSAVGPGNVRQFPFQAASNGGAAVIVSGSRRVDRPPA